MKRIDRKLFISETLNDQNYYQNKPYLISEGQTMTDIFTHAVILEEVSHSIEEFVSVHSDKEMTVLDVGTGHGYLSFVIANFINEVLTHTKNSLNYRVIGIDCNSKSIEQCNALKNIIKTNQHSPINLIFESQTLQSRLAQSEHYDIIIGGFYMPPSYHTSLLNKIK
jgi:protein-L-isoaspartate O-methyltransferase